MNQSRNKRPAKPVDNRPESWREAILDRRHLAFLGILILLVLALFVTFILLLPRNQAKQALRASTELVTKEKRDLDAHILAHAQPLSDNILTYLGGELRLESYTGQQIFVHQLAAQSPVSWIEQGQAIVADRNGHNLVLIQDQAVAYEHQLDGSFAGASLSASGQALIIDELPNDKAKVHLIASDGQRILSLGFDKTGYPITVSFTRDGKAFDVLILNSSGSTLKTVVRRYDLSGSLLGQRTLEAENGLFFGLLHDNRDLPIIYSPSQLVKLNFDEESPIYSLDFASILGAECVGSNLYLIANTQNDAYYSLYQVDGEGQVSELSNNVGRAKLVNYSTNTNKLYFVVNNVLFSQKVDDQTSLRSASLDAEILSYQVLPNGHINVLTGAGARMIRTP
ncbi:MAG: DUF5711 family protein [Eubacteriales bacterium]|nr:DUF5711 family protein [Eubacteriales bacterium]